MTITFSTDQDSQTTLATISGNDGITVAREASLGVSNAVAFRVDGDRNFISIAGEVTTAGFTTVGEVILSFGNSNTLMNSGLMRSVGLNSATSFNGNNNKVFNSGTISRQTLSGGGPAVRFEDGGTGGNLLDNSGVVEAFGASAVRIADSDPGVTNAIVNRGIIRVSNTDRPAVEASADVGFRNKGNLIITNTGTIQGNVEFGAGNDLLNSAAGIFVGIAFGGDGNDTLLGGVLGENLNGGDGNDLIDGGGGIDVMTGGAGDDLIRVDNASDAVIEAAGAGSGADVVEASASYTLSPNVETLRGIGGAALTLTGSAGAETIIANNAGNRLVGGAGADQLVGGAGNDTFVFDGADGITDTFGGFDTVETAVSFTILPGIEAVLAVGTDAVSLFGSANADRLTGNGAANNLSGNAGNDTLIGQAGNDVLTGGDGNDNLDGGVGNDRLLGQNGNDVLSAGTGRNTLTGGKGADVFVFRAAPSKANLAVLTDFKHGQDKIHLDNFFLKKAGGNGKLKAGVLVQGSKALDASDHLIYNQKTGILAYDASGKGGAAPVTIAILTNKPVLTVADFLVI